jgi:hypothetical protein
MEVQTAHFLHFWKQSWHFGAMQLFIPVDKNIFKVGVLQLNISCIIL